MTTLEGRPLRSLRSDRRRPLARPVPSCAAVSVTPSGYAPRRGAGPPCARCSLRIAAPRRRLSSPPAGDEHGPAPHFRECSQAAVAAPPGALPRPVRASSSGIEELRHGCRREPPASGCGGRDHSMRVGRACRWQAPDRSAEVRGGPANAGDARRARTRARYSTGRTCPPRARRPSGQRCEGRPDPPPQLVGEVGPARPV